MDLNEIDKRLDELEKEYLDGDLDMEDYVRQRNILRHKKNVKTYKKPATPIPQSGTYNSFLGN